MLYSTFHYREQCSALAAPHFHLPRANFWSWYLLISPSIVFDRLGCFTEG